jgi:fatty-acyl-CoA synthase
MGFHITHVYGLTEVYGPCRRLWLARRDELPAAEQARL